MSAFDPKRTLGSVGPRCALFSARARPNWWERAPVSLFGAPEPRASDGGFQGAAGEPSNLMDKLKRLAASLARYPHYRSRR